MRWTPGRKIEILRALKSKIISREDALTLHGISAEELDSWQRLFALDGKGGLRSTQLMKYRREEPMTQDLDAIIALTNRIKPLLAVHPPAIQGGALAGLVAIWLSGHHAEGNPKATQKLRAELLATHCFAVRQLVDA
jgi:hypothetical protein